MFNELRGCSFACDTKVPTLEVLIGSSYLRYTTFFFPATVPADAPGVQLCPAGCTRVTPVTLGGSLELRAGSHFPVSLLCAGAEAPCWTIESMCFERCAELPVGWVLPLLGRARSLPSRSRWNNCARFDDVSRQKRLREVFRI